MKKEDYCIRITVEGDRLIYEDNTRALAANLLETKILLNSIISDIAKGARFLSADIKDYFLAILMRDQEYMEVKYENIPEDIY